jgi:hypothetical protein
VIIESLQANAAVAVEDGVRAQVDRGVEELFDECTQRVGFGQARDLVAELEVVDDLLDVGREAIEVGAKIGLQLLAARASLEVTQGELCSAS